MTTPPAPFKPTPYKEKDSPLVYIVLIVVAIALGWGCSAYAKASDTTTTTVDSSYSTDSGTPSESDQTAALQTAVEQYNASNPDMTLCQSISVLGRTQAVDTVMASIGDGFDRSVVADFLSNECP